MEKSGSYVNQIVAAVKKMIINKELKVGDRLPTEPLREGSDQNSGIIRNFGGAPGRRYVCMRVCGRRNV